MCCHLTHRQVLLGNHLLALKRSASQAANEKPNKLQKLFAKKCNQKISLKEDTFNEKRAKLELPRPLKKLLVVKDSSPAELHELSSTSTAVPDRTAPDELVE